MAINIKFDSEHNVMQPKITLARRSGKRIANIPAYNINITKSFNSYAELSFDVSKYDNGKKYKYWYDVKDLRLVWVRDWNVYFEIQVQIDESDETIKHVEAKSLGESELSQVNLYDIEINTEDDIAREDYSPTVLYNENDSNLSLLNRILSKAPHYTIGHVDLSIKNIQRTFSFNNKSIYDAFEEISEEINCIFIIDSGMTNNAPARVVNVYDLEPHCALCGARGPFYTTDDEGNIVGEISSPIYAKNLRCKECGGDTISLGYGKSTPIFISVENLADSIQYDTDVDSVKNCFKLEAGDDIMTSAIRSINPNGSSYIWHISNDIKEDMSDALVSKLDEYNISYDYYMNDYTPDIDDEILTKYNYLINKYSVYNPNLKIFDTSVPGFSNLVQAFYDNIDFESYLENEFMPSPELPDIGADIQAAKLTSDTINIAAVSNLRTCSTYTATASVLSIAKTLIDAGYSVKALTSQYADETWTGTLVVTNNSDASDTAITEIITVEIVDDYQEYIEQSIKKQLDSKSDEYADMVTIFSYDNDMFLHELHKYCVSELEVFHDSCQAVLDILIKQGASSVGTFYDNYYTKLGIIDSELIDRNSEISIIREMQNAIRDIFEHVKSSLNFETYLGDSLWNEFIAYRREDTYSNSNFISDGLSNAEIIKRATEFMDIAMKDIYKSSTLQHSITANIWNLLTMEEFLPLVDYFEDGNWIHVKVDGNVYRLRLIEYDVSFDNNDIGVKFSDVISAYGSVHDLESVVNQMTSISSSYEFVARQASLGNKGNNIINDWINRGLDTTAAKIINNADNQSQVWDEHGMLFKQNDPMSGTDTGEQLKIVNSTIAITDDNWQSVKTAIGRFYYVDPNTGEYVQAYGINGEVLVGKLILGQELGIYSTAQTMKFNEDGLEITNGTNTFKVNPNDLSSMFVLLNGDDKVLYTDSTGNTVYKGTVVVEGDNVSVSIDPNAQDVFSISTVDGDVISVDANGNAVFKGAINSNSAKIGDDTRYISYDDGRLIVAADTISIGGENIVISISDAKKYATNYLYYSQNKGLVVAGSAPSDDSGVDSLDDYNSRITSNGFDVYEDGTTRVAHFGEITTIGRAGQSQQIIDNDSLAFTSGGTKRVFEIENGISGVGMSETIMSVTDGYLDEYGAIDREALANILNLMVDSKTMTSSDADYVSTVDGANFVTELYGYGIEPGVGSTDYKHLSDGYACHKTLENGVLTIRTTGEGEPSDWYEFIDEFIDMFPAGTTDYILYMKFILTYQIEDVQMTLGARDTDSAIGARSVSIGTGNSAIGTGAVAIGKNLRVYDDYSMIVGENNIDIENPNTGAHMPTAFAIGANDATPFAVLKNGIICMSSANSGVSPEQSYPANSKTNVRITFADEYPSTPFVFLTLKEDNVPTSAISDYSRVQIFLQSVDTTGFTATIINGGSNSHTFSFNWFAISIM